jgi:hypothetical protein
MIRAMEMLYVLSTLTPSGPTPRGTESPGCRASPFGLHLQEAEDARLMQVDGELSQIDA